MIIPHKLSQVAVCETIWAISLIGPQPTPVINSAMSVLGEDRTSPPLAFTSEFDPWRTLG